MSDFFVLVLGLVIGFILGWLYRDWQTVKHNRPDNALQNDGRRLIEANTNQALAADTTPEFERLQSELQILAERSKSLETELDIKTAAFLEAEAWQESLQETLRSRDRAVSDLEARLRVNDSALQSSPTTTNAAAKRNSSAQSDDLKQIKGIGPVIEGQLMEIGIASYRQIAQFTESDIERVANHIEGFPDRIRRDDWIGQARALHKAKYGEQI